MVASRTLVVALLLSPLAGGCGGAGDAEVQPDAGNSMAAQADVPRPGADRPFEEGTELWLAPLLEGEGNAEGPRLGEGRNVTRRAGYDNQPEFAPDGTLFYTLGVGDRTDIWRYDPEADAHLPVTATPDQSEYSATPMPGWEGASRGLSIIRVEPDSAQRLWAIRLGPDGAVAGEEVLLPGIRPVGYHAWANDSLLALFVLGDPPTLQRAVPGPGTGEVVAGGIGRGIERMPGEEAVSYTVARDGEYLLMRYHPSTGQDAPIPLGIPFLPGPDHAWTPGGVLLYGSGNRLYGVRPGSAGPVEVGALPDPGLAITRLAVSPDGRWVALVVERGEG